MKKVDILIPNWHCLEAIELAVESIRAFTPQEDYHLVVHDDGLHKEQLKKGFTYRNRDYLRKCAKKGWLELIESNKNIGHGASLDLLINRSKADFAIVLDCDIQILKHGWLKEAMSCFKKKKDFVFCDTEQHATAILSYPTWINTWFIMMDMKVYRDNMWVDWNVIDVDGVRWNPGAALLAKLETDNPKNYRILPIPKELRPYYYHHVHMSCISTVSSHDTKSFVSAHERRFGKIRRELKKLRASV